MIAQCPRCGNPRQGDRAFCPVCGLDLRTAQAPTAPSEPIQQPIQQPFQQPAPVAPPPPTYAPQPQQYAPPQQYSQPAYGQQPPSTCPRCHAAIYAGYQQCGNCGLDLRAPYAAPMAGMAPMSAPVAKKSSLPTLLVVGALLAVVAAGAFFVVNQNNKNTASPGPNSSGLAAVSASASADATTTLGPGKTPAATSSKAPKSQAPATGGTGGTPSGWTTFTAPDATWSAKFPTTPTSSNQTAGTTAGMAVTMWYSVDATSGAAYFVATMDAGSLLSTMGTDAFLELMAQSMGPALAGQGSGTVSSTTDSTLSGHPAKTFLIKASGADAVMTMSAVGPRVYMVLTTSASTGAVFTDYFMANFKLK